MINNFEDAVKELYFYEVTHSAGGFQTQLFDLLKKADSENFSKLAGAFPYQAAALTEWSNAGDFGNDLFRRYGLLK